LFMNTFFHALSIVAALVLGVTGAAAQRGPSRLTVPTGYALDTPDLSKPTLDKMPMPFYPAAARAHKVEGALDLRIVVGADGTVLWAEVVKSLDKTYGTDEQAMFAISKWVFRPGTLKGVPVSVAMTCHFGFTLPGVVGLTGLTP
jgi:TonB family protein